MLYLSVYVSRQLAAGLLGRKRRKQPPAHLQTARPCLQQRAQLGWRSRSAQHATPASDAPQPPCGPSLGRARAPQALTRPAPRAPRPAPLAPGPSPARPPATTPRWQRSCLTCPRSWSAPRPPWLRARPFAAQQRGRRDWCAPDRRAAQQEGSTTSLDAAPRYGRPCFGDVCCCLSAPDCDVDQQVWNTVAAERSAALA